MGALKHTPGPWQCDEVRTQCGRAFRIGSGEMLSAGKGCCIIYDDYPGNPVNERGANARLIAAAPDLLALAIQYRDDLKRPPKGDSLARRLEAIEAALAKVEGPTDA